MKIDPELASKRCANHWQREAAARCPECRRYFCRECITEHEDRILCASCLRQIASGERKESARGTVILRGFQFLLGLFILWIFFYYIGRSLLLMPDEFHEGTVWQESD